MLKDLDSQLKKHGVEEVFEVKEVLSNVEGLINRIEKGERILNLDYDNPEHGKLTHDRLAAITNDLDIAYDKQRIITSTNILIIRYKEVLKDEQEFKSMTKRCPDTEVQIKEIDFLIDEDKRILRGAEDIKIETEKIFSHLEKIVKLGKNNLRVTSKIVLIGNSVEKRVKEMRKEAEKMKGSISKVKHDVTQLSRALNESVHNRKLIHDKVKFLDNELRRHILTTVNPNKAKQ